jgi:hypothetical protein
MTIKFEYKCNQCGNDYIEQRGIDEPNPFLTACYLCKVGSYEEIAQTVLASEPERVAAPEPEIIDVEEVPQTPELE